MVKIWSNSFYLLFESMDISSLLLVYIMRNIDLHKFIFGKDQKQSDLIKKKKKEDRAVWPKA